MSTRTGGIALSIYNVRRPSKYSPSNQFDLLGANVIGYPY